MFTQYNTEGYTDEQLAELNAELAKRLRGLDPDTEAYHEAEKDFNDEVARR